MEDIEYSLSVFKHLRHRAIVPLLLAPSKPAQLRALAAQDLPDLSNVQGDVIYLFPKNAENFIFFRINDARSFRKALGSFKPTTSADVRDNVTSIANAKAEAHYSGKVKIIPLVQTQVAFSRTGMNFLGEKEATGDFRFDNRAMRDDKTFLGDQSNWHDPFNKTNVDEENGSVTDDEGSVHGVFSVAGSSPNICEDGTSAITDLFGSSITVTVIRGRGRPDPFKGKEHFGYEDGVSQPALRGVTVPHKGQIQVDPGVIIMGYPGDPIFDDPDPNLQRPSWTKDGTIMIFRKLEQSVVEYDAYLAENGPRWREFIPDGRTDLNLSNQEGADLFGARLFGRWKSGAPLARAPFRDDKVMAVNPDENNDFDYVVRNNPKVSSREPSNFYCPFTAHTRKIAPRNLDPYIKSRFLESGSTVRGGIPYGREVTKQEREDGKSSDEEDLKRGLLFLCYQSSLDSGFVRQTVGYAGNDYFPMTSLLPRKHGQDPIIGGPPPKGSPSEPRTATFIDAPPSLQTGDPVNLLLTGRTGENVEVSGFANVSNKEARPPPGVPQQFFVTSRGGEYFFVPSVSTLKTWAGEGKSAGLDIIFLQDATASMQKYIDQARDEIRHICDTIVASAEWEPEDLRVGLVTFRDHPPQESNFLTKTYSLTSDVSSIERNLVNLVSNGGGDSPEAQTDALAEALDADWRDDATKIVVLVTDSPPHGIGEEGDKIPDGCPLQHDPVRIATRLGENGITLYVMACEPTLSRDFSRPLDFYTGIVQKSEGKLVSLADVEALSDLIIGSVSDTVASEELVTSVKDSIRAQAAKNVSFEDMSKDLFDRFTASNVQLNTFVVEDIYEDKEQGHKNAKVWFEAEKLDAATRAKIQPVKGFRIKQKYRNGGIQSMSLVTQPVSLDQVKSVVRRCLMRRQ